MSFTLNHLKALESEAIYVIREAAAQFQNPVILFSGGKDSITVTYLARKAFYPAPIPFPLLHIDTGNNFQETLDYRDRLVAKLGAKLLVASVQESIDRGRVAEEKGYNASRIRLQSSTLLDAIEKYKFDCCLGGARRDEEKARAKERFFSHRDEFGQWDPKNQRPELWNLFNGRMHVGENFRVFPISNWTELDIWQYMGLEKFDLPSLYFSHRRRVFERDGVLLAESPFIPMKPGEVVEEQTVRFRTIGDITSTGATRSDASNVEQIIQEIAASRVTERGGRADDKRSESSMEDRKKEGYFCNGRRTTNRGRQTVACLLRPLSKSQAMFDSESYMNMELLRFTTAGSVDDGKSTLIGRLLYDSKSIFEDQYENIKATSERRGENYVNLALLTDGLRAEREQGITIDVAYRYFSTPKRKFIIADTPGHIQYTRNMVTGASTANLAIILIDARNGVAEQTRRHSLIASLLGIKHLAVCINKMDLVNYSKEVFDNIVRDYREFASRLQVKDIQFIPISALNGDNVVSRSAHMPWYEGVTLLYLLETVYIGGDINQIDARFPVQYVVRPFSDQFHDYRGYAGRLSSGVLRPGDKVSVLPSGFTTTIQAIEFDGAQLAEAYAPMSVTMLLSDDIDISRGDMIVRENNQPHISQDIEVMVCWMGEKPLRLNGKYAIKHTTKDARCVVKDIKYKLDIASLHRITEDPEINMNDIGRISIRTTTPLLYDAYTRNRETGAFIMIEEGTNVTVGACIILD